MTLFSGKRLEFYSPPMAAALARWSVQNTGLSVARVVVLIDDIYDMYTRLSTPGGLYDLLRVRRDHIHHAWKLATGGTQREAFSDEELAIVETELHVRNLLRLLAWRRSEMVSAEELAKSFDVPLTVLSTKHEFDSLATVCRWPDIRSVYVSHKISEPRAKNSTSDALDERSRWEPLVFDVNSLSETLRRGLVSGDQVPARDDVGVVAIQPTAIDELRFRRGLLTNGNLTGLSGELGDRWPIPSGSMYEPPSTSAPHYRDLLTRSRTLTDQERSLIGLLTQSIYDEIAFRDHLLVSCNQGLLVFRPTAIDPRVSGGVRQEINHWTSGPQRPAAIIHVLSELRGYVEAVAADRKLLDQFTRTARNAFSTALVERDSLTDAGADWLWSNCVLDSEPISGIPSSTLTDHLGRDVSTSDVPNALERAVRHAFVAGLGSLFGSVATGFDRIAHFVGMDSSTVTSPHFVLQVSEFLQKPSSEVGAAAAVANETMLAAIVAEFDVGSTLELCQLVVRPAVDS